MGSASFPHSRCQKWWWFHTVCDSAFCIWGDPYNRTRRKAELDHEDSPLTTEAQSGSKPCLRHTARKLGLWVQTPMSNAWRGAIPIWHYRWVAWQAIHIPLMTCSLTFCSLLCSHWLVFSSLTDCRQHIGRTHLLFFHFPHFSEHYVPNTGRVTTTGDTRDTIMNR